MINYRDKIGRWPGWHNLVWGLRGLDAHLTHPMRVTPSIVNRIHNLLRSDIDASRFSGDLSETSSPRSLPFRLAIVENTGHTVPSHCAESITYFLLLDFGYETVASLPPKRSLQSVLGR